MALLHRHRRVCRHRHPPGRKVYQRGAHTIWEVDGALQKLYVQNLCLFGKLFIDHKTVCFDVEPFLCYLVTDASSQFDHVLGFFSKEKISYDHFNLACIVIFPPFQRKGYGTLLMEYSYYLSRGKEIAGTPERPLSALGLRGYVAFWTTRVLRTLEYAYDPEKLSARRIRAILAGVSNLPEIPTRKRKISQRGWAGELVDDAVTPESNLPDVMLPKSTTLARIATASDMRVEDTTLALAYADLLVESDGVFYLFRAAIDAAVKRLRIKPPILDEAYVL
ncbi:histone acetyltransferase [Malassezia psittaci]|uniref:histone acetyltransferase n=1 Tax=Malassezia psittaci TaxID=1821823 RepID=A0AAF0JC54_9BASI|nr:histone acetyltransferase [Malassezia psittaci]